MKNKLKIILLVSIGFFLLTNCQKDPKLNMPTLSKTAIPLVTKDATKDQNISFLDLSGFKGAIIVKTYYEDLPKSMDLMVTMNDDQANTAVLQANISTYPTTVNFDLAKLVELLPGLNSSEELQLGDYFKFYVNLTLEDGTIIHGNDTLYDGYNSSVANLPGSSLNVKYTVACPLDYAKTVGSYNAYSADWAVDGDVTITADEADPNTVYVAGLEAIDGNVEDLGPLPMHVNPFSYIVTAPKTVLVSITGWSGTKYHNLAYEGTGTYNTCTGTYEMKFNITVTEGNFGDYNHVFTRKE
jgi:hypothetical protein